MHYGTLRLVGQECLRGANTSFFTSRTALRLCRLALDLIRAFELMIPRGIAKQIL
jgi:hypothetical protein